MFQQQPPRPAGTVHLEFRAGKCEWDGRLVTASKTKGKIVLFTSEEEELMHFQWYDRDKKETAIDLIVINDAYFEKIEKCKDGRVYILRFTSQNDKKLFFWMQEPKEEGDAELIKKFNEAVGATVPKKGDAAQAAAPQAVAPQGSDAVDPQLRAILQQFLQHQGAAGPRTPPMPLNAVLTTEVLQSLLTDEAASAEMQALLPDSHSSPEGLREALGSPQLQQSLTHLSQAVHSDQLPVLLAGLGLDPGAIAGAAPGTDALEVLCRAMEAQSGGDSGGSAEGAGGGATGGDAEGGAGATGGGDAAGTS